MTETERLQYELDVLLNKLDELGAIVGLLLQISSAAVAVARDAIPVIQYAAPEAAQLAKQVVSAWADFAAGYEAAKAAALLQNAPSSEAAQ
jgi:hypothetical protein